MTCMRLTVRMNRIDEKNGDRERSDREGLPLLGGEAAAKATAKTAAATAAKTRANTDG